MNKLKTIFAIMKNLKTFQAAFANNLTLVAAAGMAVGTIALRCGWSCYTENCSPSATLGVDENPVCDANSVGVNAITSCDDQYDNVKVINSLQSPTQLNYNQMEEGQQLWYGTVPLATGLNKLKATAAECEQVSSEVDVPCNGGSGYGWDLERQSTQPPSGECGLVYYIYVTCLPDGNYEAWEDHSNDNPCNNNIYTEESAPLYPIVSSQGLTTWGDKNVADCPPYQPDDIQCSSINTKNWVLHSRVSNAFYNGPEETVSYTYATSTPSLTVENSVVGTWTSKN
jgi:hypothetical protein